MEYNDLIALWKSQDAKLEKALKMNDLMLIELINQKAKSSLNSLIRFKVQGIIGFVLYLLLLGYGLYYAITYYSSGWNYFIASVGAIFVINLKGFSDYIRHIYLVNKINYDNNVVLIQQQLLDIQLSIINHAKFMCLQFPFYSTFYLSNRWFPAQVDTVYLIFQCCMTGGLIYFSYWLYNQHKPENLNKKWFRIMISGSGAAAIAKALNFYKELDAFREE
ncbi:hypothetical protein SAMN05421780_101238 [Flexibacter flexilis DSM 6793]|uniref:Uncharacterized protein n=1 Tax=Flexibacter flexilis DSM 6793 TaxID=927664 RepID=A0A1I1DIB6_9BACT|nr:hypothetical protein [Flexibacter flexilis]SFB74607.1 hypothetical protein SAMN05421780_101238 [Flexibacter flexilis DSM 6793]